MKNFQIYESARNAIDIITNRKNNCANRAKRNKLKSIENVSKDDERASAAVLFVYTRSENRMLVCERFAVESDNKTSLMRWSATYIQQYIFKIQRLTHTQVPFSSHKYDMKELVYTLASRNSPIRR